MPLEPGQLVEPPFDTQLFGGAHVKWPQAKSPTQSELMWRTGVVVSVARKSVKVRETYTLRTLQGGTVRRSHVVTVRGAIYFVGTFASLIGWGKKKTDPPADSD